jgi:hypothetical protein
LRLAAPIVRLGLCAIALAKAAAFPLFPLFRLNFQRTGVRAPHKCTLTRLDGTANKRIHFFISSSIFPASFNPPPAGLFSRRGRGEGIGAMRCNLLPDSNFHLDQKRLFALSLRSLRLCASLSFLPFGLRTCFENRSEKGLGGAGAWLRCSSVEDPRGIFSFVAPRHPPRPAARPPEIFSIHALKDGEQTKQNGPRQ